jgi:hypothetical protein
VSKAVDRSNAIPTGSKRLEQLAIGATRKAVAMRKDDQGNGRERSAHRLGDERLGAAVACL